MARFILNEHSATGKGGGDEPRVLLNGTTRGNCGKAGLILFEEFDEGRTGPRWGVASGGFSNLPEPGLVRLEAQIWRDMATRAIPLEHRAHVGDLVRSVLGLAVLRGGVLTACNRERQGQRRTSD